MPEHAEQYSVLFRVAGGSRVGFGHVRRCWTLAEYLTDRQLAGGCAQVEFVADSPEAGDLLSTVGFSVIIERHPGSVDQTLHRITRAALPTICVVDDPDLAPDRLEALQHLVPAACLDDTCARFFPVELVVNGSAGADRLPYRGMAGTRYLLGPRYMLLRNAFRDAPPQAVRSQAVRRVLVLTGGGDTGAFTREIVLSMRSALPDVAMDVVIGPFGSSPAFEAEGLRGITLYRNPSDMRELMLSADLAVTGGGQTAYELAATATPSLGIRLAENQAINLRGLAEAGALWDLGGPDESGFWPRFAERVRALAQDQGARQRMGNCGRLLVDGRGAERVADHLASMAARRAVQIPTKAEP